VGPRAAQMQRQPWTIRGLERFEQHIRARPARAAFRTFIAAALLSVLSASFSLASWLHHVKTLSIYFSYTLVTGKGKKTTYFSCQLFFLVLSSRRIVSLLFYPLIANIVSK